jgi:uncharacterized protein (TIGR02757 family)
MAPGLLAARRAVLESLYADLNRRELVSPDPIQFLYAYDDPLDREIVALIASVLAYGRVTGICRSVGWVLARLPSPRAAICSGSPAALAAGMTGFRHRFTTDQELTQLLLGMKTAILRYGSLRECFLEGLSDGDHTTLGALEHLVRQLNPGGARTSLLPPPSRGSACKRLHLFLRWLVRRDDVDPGGWEAIGAARLIVPLDTHMFRIARRLGLTMRTCADREAAVEVTEGFRAFRPDDPVRYDFALTRLGMGPGEAEFVSRWPL